MCIRDSENAAAKREKIRTLREDCAITGEVVFVLLLAISDTGLATRIKIIW